MGVYVVLTGAEEFGTECLLTLAGEHYSGTMNRTLSGTSCQPWNSQTPHQHAFDELSYFPKKTTSVSADKNFCRNLNLNGYDIRPWCLTMLETVEKEFCDIRYCKGAHTFVKPYHSANLAELGGVIRLFCRKCMTL
jgi:Kringle domain